MMTEEARKVKNEYMKEWRKANRQKQNEYHKKWRENNKDKVKEYQDNYWLRKAGETSEGGGRG